VSPGEPAALLVDPTDVAAMTAAIRRLATDDALCADLAARGRTRAACFAAEGFAARMQAVYAALGIRAGDAVGVDGRNLLLARPGGVASYARGVVAALRAIGAVPVLVSQAMPAGPSAALAVWRGGAAVLGGEMQARAPRDGQCLLHAPGLFVAADLRVAATGCMTRLAAGPPPAAMHWTYPVPVVMPGVPNLYTIHDLIPLLRPVLTGIPARRMQATIAGVLRHAAHILTVSETVRQEVIGRLGVPPAQVSNAWQPLDLPDEAAACRAMRTALARHGLAERGYFLLLGTVERRKNVGRTIAAWQASGSARPLLVVGAAGRGAAAELPAPAPGGLRVLGWQDRDTVIGLLRGARALLFASLAEGFGLPAAEAMALGTPVLAAAGGATAEVTGAGPNHFLNIHTVLKHK
jgi:glycosyltransferase involved in cell wall biosynthesis